MRAIAISPISILAGCWTQTTATTPTAPPPDPQPVYVLRSHPMKSPCEVAIDHVLEISHDDLDRVFAEKLDVIREASIESCSEMHWSQELVQCFTDTTDNSALGPCQSMLTPDQMSDLMKRISEAMQQPPPTP